TGINSNAAIQGNGLFVTNNNGQQQFTRSGNFTVSSDGFLETPDGALVQGYAAVNGAVNPNGPLSSLQVGSGVSSPARATGNVTVGLNLDSNTAVGGTFSQPVQVFDSLGGTHTVTINFTKTGSNAWNYAATLPGADTGSATPTTLASGAISFNAQGQLVPTVPGPPPSEDITLGSGALVNGASALNMTWHLFDAQGNSQITQTASASAPLVTQQDGAASGNLISFSIGSDGTITGSFSRGKLQGGAIEQSNVDIAAEFSNLIQAQRGYEANAHTVTTFDQITQDTINMKAGL